MTQTLEIHESAPGDLQQIESLYPKAFPDEDLLPLVRALLAEANGVLSLTAMLDTAIVGHAIFTECGIAGSSRRAALLGPLCVLPGRQRQGIGGALVRAGLERLKTAGEDWVFVLGDPAYYGRFGFGADGRVTPPYPLPAAYIDAWQSLNLQGRPQMPEGSLSVPLPWRDEALWSA